MAKNFHEHYEHEHPDMPTDSSTGFVFAAVAAIVAGIIFYSNDYSLSMWVYLALAVAVIFAGLARFASHLLRPLNIVWFKFSLLLFKVVNPLIMFILFALVITPAGLIMQLKADPLRSKRDRQSKTYWIEKDEELSVRSMKNQF